MSLSERQLHTGVRLGVPATNPGHQHWLAPRQPLRRRNGRDPWSGERRQLLTRHHLPPAWLGPSHRRLAGSSSCSHPLSPLLMPGWRRMAPAKAWIPPEDDG